MSALRLGGTHCKWTVVHINQSLHLPLAIQKSISTLTVKCAGPCNEDKWELDGPVTIVSVFFYCCIWQRTPMHTADHCVRERAREAFAQGALLSVLHLCPVLPTGGGGLGLTDRVQHINFNCIAESLFPTQPSPPLPAPIPRPRPYPSQEDGPGGWPRSRIPFRSACWAVNTAQHQEQQVLSLPIINYPCCITLGPLTPKLQISCTILFSSPQPIPIFSHFVEFQPSQILSAYSLITIPFLLLNIHPSISLFSPILRSSSHSFVPWCISIFVQHSQVLPSDSFPHWQPCPLSSLLRCVSSSACLHILTGFPLL